MKRQHGTSFALAIDFGSVGAGESLPTVEFSVDERSAGQYALATADASTRRQQAPPLALVALALAAMTEIMPLPPSTIHVGQDVEFIAAVPIGSVVTADFRLDSRRCVREQVVSSFSFVLEANGSKCATGRVILRTSVADFGVRAPSDTARAS